MLNISDKTNFVDKVEDVQYNSVKNEIINAVTSAGFIPGDQGLPDADPEMLKKTLALYGSSMHVFNNISPTPNALRVNCDAGLSNPYAYRNNMAITFQIADPNPTDGVTFEIQGLAAKPLVDINGDPILKNNLTADEYITVVYNSSSDKWVMLPPKPKVIHVVHQAAKDVFAGSYTLGVWATRPITHILTDETGVVSLGSNTLTMPAGIYDFTINMSGFGIDFTAIRIVTDPTGTPTPIYSRGLMYYGGGPGQSSQAVAQGRFSIDAEENIQLQMIATSSETDQGMGQRIIATSGGLNIDNVNNVYLEWTFIKRF